MTGPRATPSQVARRGNPGKRSATPARQSDSALSPVVLLPSGPVIPPPPARLAATGKGEWTNIWSDRGLATVLAASPANLGNVVLYCSLHDRLAEVRRRIKRDGLMQKKQASTVRGELYTSEMVEHPLLKMETTLVQQIRLLSIQLLIDPMTRMRFGLMAKEADSPLARVLAERATRAR
ncbi:MAG: P27 family phage terminase small subunit [Ferrimicrobium sp.]